MAAACSECARVLCAWHYASVPEHGGFRPVCLPSCASPYWGRPESLEQSLEALGLRREAR